MTINSREEACKILGISTSSSQEEIKKAYKELALKWHPDKWASKSEAERKAAEEKFKEIGEAYEFLINNSEATNNNENVANDDFKRWAVNETIRKGLYLMQDIKDANKRAKLSNYFDSLNVESQINGMKYEEEITAYLKEIKMKLEDYARQIRNEPSENSESSSSTSGDISSSSSSSSDSSYSSDSDYSSTESSTKNEPYYKPFTCDWCGYTVPSDDPRKPWVLDDKKFCKKTCGESWIRDHVDQKQHEERMKQIQEDIRQIDERRKKNDEEHQKRMRKIDQDSEERRKKREESDNKWKQWGEEQDRKRKERGKERDENFLKNVKRDCINHVKDFCRIFQISDQQANELLGADWKEQINRVSEWEEAYQKVSDYKRVLEDKRWIIELPKDKERAIEWIEWFLDLKEIEDQQLNEELNVKDWKTEINCLSNEREVKRKKQSLERKIKEISKNPNKKKNETVDNLNYEQQNYAERQLRLPAGQSLKEYIRSAKTLEERKQREDEVRQLINRWEQENRKSRATTAIVGLLIFGAIIGLIIYLVKRNKRQNN